MKRTPLLRKTPLVAKSTLKAKTPLKRGKPLRATSTLERTEMPRKAETPKKPPNPLKLVKGKKSKRSDRAPALDASFLAFVRQQPCDFCGRTATVEPHHFGKHGMGTKCSDYETVPLCHEHHIEGWHRHGTLPGRERAEWLERWEASAEEMREEFEALSPKERPRPAVANLAIVAGWKDAFLEKFGERSELDDSFIGEAHRWLLSNVWPAIHDRAEWSPVVVWHHGMVFVQAERTDNGGVFDLEEVLSGAWVGHLIEKPEEKCA